MIELFESKKPVGTQINPDLNICIVKENQETGEKTWLYTHNIVTNDGDLYYAQKSVAETPTSDFGGSDGRMELRTGSATPAKGDTYQQVTTPVTASRKVKDSGYPKTNDNDSDNTGAGTDIVTWRTSWTTSDFNANAIIGGCFHVGGASPGNSSKVLTHFSITSFNKTTSDTLKIFVNHTFNGV
tara:strand:+ start:478 stop:1029 length:552 start_codon:yes stop_codon:yes gene_type:complete